MPSEIGAPAVDPGRQLVPTIDGMTASEQVSPESAEEVAALLADAVAREAAVVPFGGGSALALGNPPERYDLSLSTVKLGGIIDYEPTDLVLSVGAGARFADVQSVLAEHGQTLPIDPPAAAKATIGGLIATAASGPGRLSAGTLRDLLIGISVAHPSGTVTKAGGMVVKNVTGFDLPRLYHGSLGTLGIIVSANFKVLPLPRTEATLLRASSTLDDALAAADRIRGSRIAPAALEVAWLDGGWLTAVRLAGREGTVQMLTSESNELLGDRVELLDSSASAVWWRDYVDGQAGEERAGEVLLRCAVRPRHAAQLATDLIALLAELDLELRYLAISVGLGTATMRVGLPAAEDETPLHALQERCLRLADHVTILAALAARKQGLDVWGRTPETLDLMRALKSQFDPSRVLNPGRFAGFI